MFIACPVHSDLQDAEWYEDLYEAKENALEWSVELHGKDIVIYEAVDGKDGVYDFNKLCHICA